VLSCLYTALTFATSANAASISYFLDLSNDLPDRVDYVQVTISDSETIAGDIDFAVEVIADAFPEAGSNFGMQSFYFNAEDGLNLSTDNIDAGFSGWSARSNANAGGGFGKFDFKLSGTGNARTELLSFSITGVDDDSVFSYAIGASLTPSSGEFFAAHVAGFSDDQYGVSSAKFAGSSPVPVPPALLLFGTSLAALGLRRRRSC
jgi:hypothetical protein